MRKHTGMRPHDIPILVKAFMLQRDPWLIKDLATSVYISQSEVSESLHRSMYAELLDEQKQKVHPKRFYEFIIYGMRYVFPQKPGHLTRGMATAHSHPALQGKFISNVKYVWPKEKGETLGHAVGPFYAKQVNACQDDDELYFVLSLVEIIRVGKTREVNYAKEQLKKIFEVEK